MAFIYVKYGDPDFCSVLKFVLKNSEAVDDLRKYVRGKATYRAMPDIKKPVQLQLQVKV